MKRYIADKKSKKLIVSSTSIKTLPAGDLYKVVTASLVKRDQVPIVKNSMSAMVSVETETASFASYH